jgi:hypothetical protein
MKSRYALILFGAVLCSCTANKDLAILDSRAVRPARSADFPITVFTEGNKPARPYTAVAMAEVTGDERNLRDDIEQLKKKARAVGGDAILLRNSNAMADRGPFRTTYQITREATIIVYR